MARAPLPPLVHSVRMSASLVGAVARGNGKLPHRRHTRRSHVVRPASVTTVLAYPRPPIQARAAFLLDVRTGRVLFSKNPDMRLPMASTTKITTAILTLEHVRLHDLVPVSARAASVGESTMGLVSGERLTVRQLLYGLLLNSGNDAAVALAEYVGGTEGHFVYMMNALAHTLRMRNTHYVTPHGLDAPGHYSSARDLATIALYAMRDPTFRRIVATTSYYVPATRHNREHWLANVNRVMYWYPGIDGVKPGDTDAAGLCQVVSVNRDGRHLLAVLLNTPTLVFDVRNLLNYGLHDFRWVPAGAWWDSPADVVSGGSGGGRWRYYYGSGHYIRGLFLNYFDSHGRLQTLGYPRTEQMRDGAQIVQYFQGGELRYDPLHRSVDPVELGTQEAAMWVPRSFTKSGRVRIVTAFRALYERLGGRSVLGSPVTDLTYDLGYGSQFYQYGEIAFVNGVPYLAPSGDTALRLRGWMPANGTADAYFPTMAPGLVLTPAPVPSTTAQHRVPAPVVRRVPQRASRYR